MSVNDRSISSLRSSDKMFRWESIGHNCSGDVLWRVAPHNCIEEERKCFHLNGFNKKAETII